MERKKDLLQGIRLQDFGGDLVMLGHGLTVNRYEEIRKKLPLATRAKLIGWRTVAHPSFRT